MELSQLTPEEYLARRNLPVPELQFINSSFLETEWKRVQERRGLVPFDTSRYTVDPPLEEEKGQIAAWQKAVQKAKAQIENQTNRIVNLELMKRYGGHACKTYNQSLTIMEKSYENLMKETKSETDTLNRKRKQEQVGAGEKLQALEEQLYASLSKNHQIESACQTLEQEIATLKERVKEGTKRTDGTETTEVSMDVDGQELKKEDIEEIKKNATGTDLDGEKIR